MIPAEKPRGVLRTFWIGACAAALALGAPLTAQAFWQASAAPVSLSITPAQLGIGASSPASATMNGASGAVYSHTDVTNTGGVPLSGVTPTVTAAVTPVGGSDYRGAVAPAGTDCAASAGSMSWRFPNQLQALGALASGATVRYCLRFTWSGATSMQNGQSDSVTLRFTGAAADTRTIDATATFQATLQGAPLPPDPSALPFAQCDDSGFFPVVTFAGAPPGTYTVRYGSLSAPEQGNATAQQLVAPGFMVSPASVPQGTSTSYIVLQGTQNAIAQFVIVNPDYTPMNLSCGGT